MYTWYTSKVWATPHLKLVEPEMKILSAITTHSSCFFFYQTDFGVNSLIVRIKKNKGTGSQIQMGSGVTRSTPPPLC